MTQGQQVLLVTIIVLSCSVAIMALTLYVGPWGTRAWVFMGAFVAVKRAHSLGEAVTIILFWPWYAIAWIKEKIRK